MSLTAHQENAKALAALLGIDEADAALQLKLRIAVNFDATTFVSRTLGEHVIALLSRTVEYAGVPSEGQFDVEIIIGPREPAVLAKLRVYAGQAAAIFVVDSGECLGSCDPATPPPFLVIEACRISAAAIRAAVGTSLPVGASGPIKLDWRDLLGPHGDSLAAPLDVGEAYLAGAGAVGHGFIYTLRYFDVRGRL